MPQYLFLDECGVTTDLLRRYGRSLSGTRLRDHTPCSHWETHTVVAARRLDGLTAPAVFDGPIDNPTFLAYVEQVLPPYSPDFNPIELAFAKLKAFIRAARPRTFDHVCDLIAVAIGLFTPRECRNFVRHCGYRVSTGL